jgi:hypothetical protein
VVRACGHQRGNGGDAVGDDGRGQNWRRSRRQPGGVCGVRLWAGTDRGRGDGGRHDSVGTSQQTGSGETVVEAAVGNRECGSLGGGYTTWGQSAAWQLRSEREECHVGSAS